ncbi:MAG: hypothetical protein M1827_004875 [Pycnora praestabilis]|nr:MAG: hypothetical protein M1827_004875 [Pycnora praestabilis]
MSPPILPPACLPYGEADYIQYGYQPNLAVGIVFSILFGLIALTQTLHTIRRRALWMLFFVIGSGVECLGWIGRTVAHHCAYSSVLFTMQTATLIMGPAWTQAGVYVTLWVMIRVLGDEVSPLPPKIYLWICFCVDCVCLSLQATGGGLAGSASDDGSSTQPGTDLMVVGIIAQLICAVLFSIVLAIVVSRGASQIMQNRPIQLVALATIISTTMMITRGVYRSIELVQGWEGFLITHEGYVIGLDAVPMVIAMGGLALFNPSALFSKQRTLMARNNPNQDIVPDEEKAMEEAADLEKK